VGNSDSETGLAREEQKSSANDDRGEGDADPDKLSRRHAGMKQRFACGPRRCPHHCGEHDVYRYPYGSVSRFVCRR
jgi:hypothetical protein